MALRGRQHAGHFAIGFTQLTIGGASNQATLRLHRGELHGQSERERIAQRILGAHRGQFGGDDVE